MDGNEILIRVSATSRPALVAGSIAKAVRAWQHAEVQAIGAAAVHQAVKAIAIALGFLKQDGITAAFVPQFSAGDVHGSYRTAIRFLIDVIRVDNDPASPPGEGDPRPAP